MFYVLLCGAFMILRPPTGVSRCCLFHHVTGTSTLLLCIIMLLAVVHGLFHQRQYIFNPVGTPGSLLPYTTLRLYCCYVFALLPSAGLLPVAFQPLPPAPHNSAK
jgi:hypothetical protein